MYKKVVVLGGGTGISYLLRGLKEFPIDITAVITVSDNGRSTGKLREEFHTPAVGDIRRVITSLSGIDEPIKKIQYEDIKDELGRALVEQMSTEEVVESTNEEANFSLNINLNDNSLGNSAWDLVKRHKQSK